MRKLILLFLLSSLVKDAGAQTAAQYIFSTATNVYADNTSGTTVAIAADEGIVSNVPIGFTFKFCGVPYTTVSASSNGWLSFKSLAAATNGNTTANLTTIGPAVMPLWDNLDGNSGSGSSSYQVTGSAPYRVFTFEWRNWQWNSAATGTQLSFQVKLFETTNIIWFMYDPETNAGSVNAPSASIGIGTSGTDYLVLDNTSATPTPSSTTFTTNIAAPVPASGLTYIWKPNINSGPTIPGVTGGGAFCSGDSVILTATVPPGLSGTNIIYWEHPSGATTTNTTLKFYNAQSSINGNYIVRLLTYSCPTCIPDTSEQQIVTVFVTQRPAKPIVAPVIVYCQGDFFDSIPIFGQNLLWYSVPAGGSGVTTPPVINTSIIGTVTYFVSQSLNGCESPRAAVTINVVPKPSGPQVVSPVVYCQGDVARPLEALGQNIRWYSVASGGVGTPIAPVPGTNAQGTFTWYVSQTVSGCESQRVPIDVKVSYIPNALITVSRPYVCQYDTLTLGYFGNASTTADYIWSLPEGGHIVTGSGQGPLVVQFDSFGVKRVKLTVDNGGCKGPETFVDIPVKRSPLLLTDMRTDACKDEIVNIAVSYATTGIDRYEWDFGGAEVVYGSLTAGPYGIRWNSGGQKVIKVTANDEECISLPVYDTIMIHDLPDARFSINRNDICASDSIEFRASVSDDTYSYQWQPAEFFGERHSPVEWGRADTSGYVVLTVTSKYNCRSSDSVLIQTRPCCEIHLPDAFTPNNDGRNDVFRILTAGNHTLSVFHIRNRWGQVVFETADEMEGWDGSFNGRNQDMNMYFYYIKYKCADGNYYEKTGQLLLIR